MRCWNRIASGDCEWPFLGLRLYAICRDCGWTCEAKNAVGVAAQHARRHEHTVDVEVTRNVRFGPVIEEEKDAE